MKHQNLSKLLTKFYDNILFHIHTIQPGKFISYNENTKIAKVQPLIKLKDVRGNDYEITPIDNVPVIFPLVSKFNLNFPIQKDDGCLLLFSELPLGNYLAATNNKVNNADDSNKFELANCIALPGLYSPKNLPVSNVKIEITSSGNITIQTLLGKIEITSSGNITLNNGTEPYVLGTTAQVELNKEAANMQALKSAINGWTPVPNDGGAALKTALAAFLALDTENYSSILSTQIKGV